MVASVNVIITKELLAGTPNRRNRTRIASGREELRVATGKRLIGGAVVPSTPERKELISSMFYFNRCVKGRRFAGVPVSENPGVLGASSTGRCNILFVSLGSLCPNRQQQPT